jgi:hypothetical protein
MGKYIGTLIVPSSDLAKQLKVKPRNQLTWTTDRPGSHYGMGVLLYSNGHILDSSNFRRLRDLLGATIETSDPVKVCRALGVPLGERGVVGVS